MFVSYAKMVEAITISATIAQKEAMKNSSAIIVYTNIVNLVANSLSI